jgi:hypothetical protein
MEITCGRCGRMWFLEADPQVWRDAGSVRCRCGEELYSWTRSAVYKAIQIFANPARLQGALRTLDPEGELLRGTTITVTTHRLYVGDHTGSRACRIILVEGSKRLVSEDELLAALGDPRPPGSN